jgi:hypothetical protein
MDHQEAVALIAVGLEALIHRRRVGPDVALTYMPVGLLSMALDQLEQDGGDTSELRAQFKEKGFDLSEIPHCTEISEHGFSDHSESTAEPSGSRVPKVIANAILAKFQAGWSKSRIAREFQLNRRTIIRICAGC